MLAQAQPSRRRAAMPAKAAPDRYDPDAAASDDEDDYDGEEPAARPGRARYEDDEDEDDDFHEQIEENEREAMETMHAEVGKACWEYLDRLVEARLEEVKKELDAELEKRQDQLESDYERKRLAIERQQAVLEQDMLSEQSARHETYRPPEADPRDVAVVDRRARDSQPKRQREAFYDDSRPREIREIVPLRQIVQGRPAREVQLDAPPRYAYRDQKQPRLR